MSQPQNRTLVTVRRATQADVVAACDVVRRSIQELCIADHQNDQPTLTAWLENKAEPFFKRLIDAQSKSSVVAIRKNQVCGFGLINHTGEIGLLYVAPEARFIGVSSMMLEWLEVEAARVGLNTVFLRSSQTALRFYKSRGYIQTAEPTAGFGITQGYPMAKRLGNNTLEPVQAGT